jgi:hypothetical protein
MGTPNHAKRTHHGGMLAAVLVVVSTAQSEARYGLT